MSDQPAGPDNPTGPVQQSVDTMREQRHEQLDAHNRPRKPQVMNVEGKLERSADVGAGPAAPPSPLSSLQQAQVHEIVDSGIADTLSMMAKTFRVADESVSPADLFKIMAGELADRADYLRERANRRLAEWSKPADEEVEQPGS